MNETVKAALLGERARWLEECHSTEKGIERLEHTMRMRRLELTAHREKLADIELHLRDNGVDLAAVDAEAGKARASSALQCAAGINQTSVLGGNYGQALSSLNGDISNQLRGSQNARNTFDPTAGLAKALDEA